ncbi:MAG: efflux RND transporter periplasmic adaptor subunit [Acidobacteria bacterium]|nr:efflux RND transporter periplasmic adaptor subunit [Acidobacteriota bacterium]
MRKRMLFLAAVVCLAGCGKRGEPSVVTASTTKKTVVAVSRAEQVKMSDDLVLTAEFAPYQEVDVMAKISGYIKKVYVDVGDRVKAGQLLAELEVPEMGDELIKANAGIARSKADVARALTEVERAETAHKMAHLTAERVAAVAKNRPGLVAQQEVDDSKNRDLVAEAQIATAKSTLAAVLKSVDVSEAEARKATTLQTYLQVTAPFAGVVTKRFIDNGAMIQAGTSSHTQALPVVRISDNRMLRLMLPVPESAVSQVRLGASVKVRVPSIDREVNGRVARFSQRIVTATRTMETEVDVANPQGVLVPGMFAEAAISLREPRQALSVPVMAVDRTGDSSSVLVVKSDGTVERRNVSLGLESADRLEIRSGLSTGELVVIGRRDTLKPGQQVEPKETVMGPMRGQK